MVDDFVNERSLFRQALPPAGSYSLAALRLDEMKRDEAVLWLGPEEQEIHRRLSAAKRGAEWLAGRLAAKTAIARLLGLTLSEVGRQIAVLARADGKPLVRSPFSGSRPVEVSISHSGNVAAAMAAVYPCGLDVQRLSAAAVRVRDRFASPLEYDILTSLLPLTETECLTILWAAKEALRKMVPCHPLAGFRELQLTGGSAAGPRQAVLRFALGRPSGNAELKAAAFLRPEYAWALTGHM